MAKKTEKKLEEVLMTIPANRKVKIGTESGGAYFIAGTATEIIASLEELNTSTKKAWGVKLTNAENGLRAYVASAPTYSAYLTRIISRNFDRLKLITDEQLSYESYLTEVKAYKESVRRKISTVTKLREIIAKYSPLASRNVTEVRKALKAVDEDTTIIMIDGYETGTVWMFSEVSKGRLFYMNEKDSEQEAADV